MRRKTRARSAGNMIHISSGDTACFNVHACVAVISIIETEHIHVRSYK